MPGVNPALLKSVVYLYPNESDAKSGSKDGGTGFLVAMPFGAEPLLHGRHLYLVTTLHTATRLSGRVRTLWARYTGADPGQEIEQIDETRWVLHPDHDTDVAVAAIADYPWAMPIPYDSFLKPNNGLIGPGTDVFMISRFLPYDGGMVNRPAVRWGTVSMMPGEPIVIEQTAQRMECFAIEVRSIGGHSGSPVLGDYMPWAAMHHTAADWMHKPRLYGIDCGHFPSVTKVGRRTREIHNSGIAYAAPAWKIAEILETDQLITQRAEVEKRLPPD